MLLRWEVTSSKSTVATVTLTSSRVNCGPWATISPLSATTQQPSKYSLPPSQPIRFEYTYTPPHLLVESIIRSALVCSFRKLKWDPDPFVKTSTPSRPIVMCVLCPVKSSSHISEPIKVSLVDIMPSPIGAMVYETSDDSSLLQWRILAQENYMYMHMCSFSSNF